MDEDGCEWWLVGHRCISGASWESVVAGYRGAPPPSHMDSPLVGPRMAVAVVSGLVSSPSSCACCEANPWPLFVTLHVILLPRILITEPVVYRLLHPLSHLFSPITPRPSMVVAMVFGLH